MFKKGRKVLLNKKGQGATEYVVVVAGLVGAFLSFYVFYSHLVPKQFDQGAKLILMDYNAK